MSVFLQGLALQNYRGIGPDWVDMHKFKRFNFFVGANNAGKSTVLNFISTRLPAPERVPSTKPQAVEPLERHSGSPGATPRVAFPQPVPAIIETLDHRVRERSLFDRAHLEKLLKVLADETGNIWIENKINFAEDFKLRKEVDLGSIRGLLGPQASWNRLWASLTGRSGGGIDQYWIPETLLAIQRAINFAVPRTRIVPAIRQIAASDGELEDYSGAGLIARLAKIQSPDFDHREDRDKFDRINRFLQTVTDRPGAMIEIPHGRNHVLVHMDGKVLPLSSLGTGIHEVVMLAAFCTLSEEEILCIEEPEIHLHPLLQRKLIAYLQAETNNQYFIATHSASFIDTPGAAVYHVQSDGRQTQITEAQLQRQRHAICMDLGHRASDIVQANAVIWVEGPSDRIYLKHWIRAVDPNLREGIHYSIMFYGGRLLSHLSADDEDVDEFIGLRALNRHLAILMDSDKESAHSKLNATKRRIKSEFEQGESVAWITKGREVENYIDHSELQAAVKDVVGPDYASALAGGQFDHALHYKRSTLKKTRTKPKPTTLTEKVVDKVKVARRVVENAANLDVLDLKARVSEIVQMIHRANA